MRVVYTGLLPPAGGGAPISSWLLLQQLARNGLRVRAVSSVPPGMHGEFELFRQAHPEIPLVPYDASASYADASSPRPEADDAEEEGRIVSRLEQLLSEEPADLILAGREVESRAVVEVAARHRIPWVLRCGGYTLYLLEQGLVPRPFGDAIVRSIRRAEATIVQAGHLATLAEEMGCRRVNVIPSPLDLSMFSPRPKRWELARQWEIPRGARVVLHASNMKEVKRVHDIIGSAAHVLRGNSDIFYVIAGSGPSLPSVEQRCRDLGIANQFRFTGKVDYAGMPDLLCLADVVVMASAFEQQARVYLEAQATARVLISSDIAGARAVVEDGVTGLLYPSGDVEALAAVTLRALNDPALRAHIGGRARVRVQAHSHDTIGTRAANLLEDVVRCYRTVHA